MISKTQYHKLRRMINQGKTIQEAADKAGMDVKTANRYLATEEPFQAATKDWERREDHFKDTWPEIEEFLQENPRLEAKAIFEHLCRKYPGKFQEGQLRTLQRRFKEWKALHGTPKEVYFDQIHYPADLCQSDFTHLNNLEITIQGMPFAHLLYHFVLTYSNWESVTICYSENLESLMEGIQNALWQLGGVPKRHRSDRLTAAVKNLGDCAQFTTRYQELMNWYGLNAEKSQAGCPNENGDIEQSHHRLKRYIDQALTLRRSREFDTIEAYRIFLQSLIIDRNRSRTTRFVEEQAHLKPLPEKRMSDWSELWAKVSQGSTIRVKGNTYSVPSSLIQENVQIKIRGSLLSVFYAGQLVEEFPRLTGTKKSQIHYRHVIDWLIRKPGAFENYRYREEMYPSSVFRAAYDALKSNSSKDHVKQYLHILHLALTNGEKRVEMVLRQLLATDNVSLQTVQQLLSNAEKIVALTDVSVSEVNLGIYDQAFLQEV